MYGVYAWNAGAASASILADVVRLLSGGDVAGCTAASNKSSSSVAGVGAGSGGGLAGSG